MYLLGGDEEAEKMGVFEPGFGALAAPPPASPPAPGAGAELVASVIPDRYTELRGSLPLYLDDLPATPGAVVPGLALDIVAALGKLLTPGTTGTGAAEIRALNSVLSGGPANRHRAASIMDSLLATLRLRDPRPQDAKRCRPVAIGDTARKLFGHLAVRWDDDALTGQHRRHRDAVAHLSAAVGGADPVALAVTGSFTAAPGGWWHPFLSDIDVMPLRRCEPSPAQIAHLQQIYHATPRPPWVYLNTGACAGVGGLDHDPRRRLFVAEHLPSLDVNERRLLGVLLGPSRFLTGDRGIYDAFRAWPGVVRAHAGEGHPR